MLHLFKKNNADDKQCVENEKGIIIQIQSWISTEFQKNHMTFTLCVSFTHTHTHYKH